ncbi:hypothetical protein ACFVHQ_10835 [Actinomycetes bacterium NPDC127524]
MEDKPNYYDGSGTLIVDSNTSPATKMLEFTPLIRASISCNPYGAEPEK